MGEDSTQWCSLYCKGTPAIGVVLVEFGMMNIPLPVCQECFDKLEEGTPLPESEV